MPDDELTVTIGAREIYDAIQETKHEVSELRKDRDEDVADRANLWTAVRELQRIRWHVRGAVASAGIALGWLIEARVIHK